MWNVPLQKKCYKKKLHLLNPQKEVKPIEVHVTKRGTESRSADVESIERGVRELLAQKVSGTLLGIWLLIPEHLRLGTWDLLTTWTGDNHSGIKPRLALQMVHESALCTTGIRQTRSLCHQSFELANGLPYIATDEEVHYLLDEHSIDEAKKLQIRLALLRQCLGHYKSNILAFDPHRIRTYSRRIMPKKKSRPNERSNPVLQTFFGLDVQTGQPLGFTIGSSGKTTTRASLELLEMMDMILPSNNVLLLADTEHESCRLIDHIIESDRYDILMPAARKKAVINTIKNLEYKRHWAGYATAETQYRYKENKHEFRLIGQRSGEKEEEYNYKPFITTGDNSSLELITEDYPERWTIEEFFNFEGAMGWDRASTMNLNIRYGKLSLALIAQAATYQLKKILPKPYRKWTAPKESLRDKTSCRFHFTWN
ncbi:MAG: transposase [Candidatus Marinimicrobia bacterium]|nr:transposase [Candidatus Neomarinimicrobiota bacterium]